MNSEVVGRLVKDVDDKGVALSDTYGRAGEASIHRSNHLLVAEPPNRQVLHLKSTMEGKLYHIPYNYNLPKDFMRNNMHVELHRTSARRYRRKP